MAVPTITSVTPTAGHTGGKTLCEIEGTGFRVPVAPAAVNGIVPEAKPSLRVRFGSKEAKNVVVVSSTLAYASTPIHDVTDGLEGRPAAVSVTVQNLDAEGVAIGGEFASLPAAYRYQRPNLASDTDSDLVRLIRAFLDELARQITPNVTWPQHTDYDADTGDLLSQTEVPPLPALIVAATDLEENDFYAVRDPQETPNPDDPDGFVTREPPVTVDLVFTIVGVSDNNAELLNLSAATKRFFRKNPRIAMARDPDDASKGEVEYEMSAEESGAKIAVGASRSNIRSFSLTARIVGFDIEAMHDTQPRGPGGADEATIGIGRTLETLEIEPTVQRGIS